MLSFWQWLLNTAPETKEIFGGTLLGCGAVYHIIVKFGLMSMGRVAFALCSWPVPDEGGRLVCMLHDLFFQDFVGVVGSASRQWSACLAWF
jgi:hypothetical protein